MPRPRTTLRRKGIVQKFEKQQTNAFGKLAKTIDRNSRGMITLREMEFSRLVALEGFDFSAAYVESFQPETTSKDSIYAMASRMAKRPRIVMEIDRLKRKEEEDLLAEQARKDDEVNLTDRLNDPDWVRNKIIKGLYLISESEADGKTRLKAYELLGKVRHINMYTSGSTFNIDQSKHQTLNSLSVPNTNSPDTARASVMEQLGRLLGSPSDTNVIDLVDNNSVIDLVAEE